MLWHQNVTIINGCMWGVAPGYNGCAVAAINAALTDWWLFINHCQRGMFVGMNTSAYGSQVIFMVNDTGCWVEMGAVLNLAILGNFPQLNTLDLYATRMSYISYRKGGGPAPSVNPSTNPGNQNSWIEVMA